MIDDHDDIRENTAEILEPAGYKTLTAENKKEGVEIAIKEKPSVFICDIMIPELDGYGVLHLLRKKAKRRIFPDQHDVKYCGFLRNKRLIVNVQYPWKKLPFQKWKGTFSYTTKSMILPAQRRF
ncbi:MAG: response regulator [Chitinophagales bacterium]